MQLARIIGTATATVKHPSLAGVRLAIGQPLRHDRETPDGDPQLVIDTLAAAVGDLVVLTSAGDTTPARWSTIGIVDP
jgi:ethanolamine utilization protein EutN